MRQRLVIELKIDVETENQAQAVRDMVRQRALHVLAGAALLNLPQKPEVICYADDFMVGRTEIDLLASQLSPEEVRIEQDSDGEAPSSELLGALRGN